MNLESLKDLPKNGGSMNKLQDFLSRNFSSLVTNLINSGGPNTNELITDEDEIATDCQKVEKKHITQEGYDRELYLAVCSKVGEDAIIEKFKSQGGLKRSDTMSLKHMIPGTVVIINNELRFDGYHRSIFKRWKNPEAKINRCFQLEGNWLKNNFKQIVEETEAIILTEFDISD